MSTPSFFEILLNKLIQWNLATASGLQASVCLQELALVSWCTLDCRPFSSERKPNPAHLLPFLYFFSRQWRVHRRADRGQWVAWILRGSMAFELDLNCRLFSLTPLCSWTSFMAALPSSTDSIQFRPSVLSFWFYLVVGHHTPAQW